MIADSSTERAEALRHQLQAQFGTGQVRPNSDLACRGPGEASLKESWTQTATNLEGKTVPVGYITLMRGCRAGDDEPFLSVTYGNADALRRAWEPKVLRRDNPRPFELVTKGRPKRRNAAAPPKGASTAPAARPPQRARASSRPAPPPALRKAAPKPTPGSFSCRKTGSTQTPYRECFASATTCAGESDDRVVECFERPKAHCFTTTAGSESGPGVSCTPTEAECNQWRDDVARTGKTGPCIVMSPEEYPVERGH